MIDRRLRDAIAGRGSLLLIEGPAGIGKTRLVLAAGQRGRELGLTTLSARGSELERDFAYGLVRQLFEVPLVAASPPERAELLAGAAGHAARLFGLAAARDDAADALLDPSFAILHGLYWLSANLGRRTPLLLCVDDVHWADQASLRFLHYLGRRLQELPIAVVAATRPARPAGGSPLLAALAADPSAEVLEVAPLSQPAVAELMRLAFGTEVDAGLRGRVPRGDRRRSVPRPRTRPSDRRGPHRADGGGLFPRRGPGAARGLPLGRAAAEPPLRPRSRASPGGGRAGRGGPSARSRPRRGGPQHRRDRGRRARRRRDPRRGPAVAVRPPDRPGGGRG